MNKEIRAILENSGFKIHENGNEFDLETWTDCGVNMFVQVNKINIVTDFRCYVESFDVDEEIDLHRQTEAYRNAFTIRAAVNDFETFEAKLQGILIKFEAVEIVGKIQVLA